MKRAVPFVAVVALVTLSLGAATFVVPSDEILIQKAEAIVEGEVLTTFSRYGDRGRIETVAVISVSANLKGVAGAEIEVVHPGGRLGEVGLFYPGVPDFEPGDRVLLFLTRDARGNRTTVDLALGKFRYAKDTRGRLLAIREFDEIGGWDLSGKEHVERHREAQRFRTFIREVAGGASPEARYYVEVSDEEVRAMAAPVTIQAGESPNDYTFLDGSNGVRWNNFASTTQLFYNRNSQIGITDGGVSALEDALAAWTNDCDSLIKYEYGGVNVNARGAGSAEADFDGINGVVFLDVFGDITGSFSCVSGGTLGIGGPWYGGTHVQNGDTMYTILEGNVTIQDGVDCWAGLSDGRFTQLLVHELGHSLGFRHSDQPAGGQSPNTTAAIMRASLVENFGSTLQAYDKDAAATVYPGGMCSTIGDLNLDGNADLLWRRSTNGANAVWYMDGATRLSAATLDSVGDLNWSIVGSGDFDGDSDSDILWRNSVSGGNVVWYMDGATRSGIVALDTVRDLDWIVVSVADFDGDGDADILWYNTTNGKLAIWYMDGVVRSSIATFDQVRDLNWQPMGMSDFDGDGDPDLVWRNLVTGVNAVWYVESAARVAINTIDSVGDSNWRLVAVGDLDGDGDGDIVWRHWTNGKNVVWTMNGLTRSSITSINTVSDTSWQVVAPN